MSKEIKAKPAWSYTDKPGIGDPSLLSLFK